VSEMHEPGVLAAGEEPVREYLRRLGMPEPDISVYLDEARRGPGPAPTAGRTTPTPALDKLSDRGPGFRSASKCPVLPESFSLSVSR
jgi:hypothetical protein